MMRWIVGAVLKFRILVLPVAVTLIALGIIQLRDPRVEVLPEFTPPTVEDSTRRLPFVFVPEAGDSGADSRPGLAEPELSNAGRLGVVQPLKS